VKVGSDATQKKRQIPDRPLMGLFRPDFNLRKPKPVATV
jgi:hypothetical protein